MNLKELSATTILLGMLYFAAYSFYSGFSVFYGFPSNFISVGVAELVKFSVVVSGIVFSLVSFLHLDTEGRKLPFVWAVIFTIIAICIVFGTFYGMGGRGYLYEHSKKTLVGYSILIGFLDLSPFARYLIFLEMVLNSKENRMR